MGRSAGGAILVLKKKKKEEKKTTHKPGRLREPRSVKFTPTAELLGSGLHEDLIFSSIHISLYRHCDTPMKQIDKD